MSILKYIGFGSPDPKPSEEMDRCAVCQQTFPPPELINRPYPMSAYEDWRRDHDTQCRVLDARLIGAEVWRP